MALRTLLPFFILVLLAVSCQKDETDYAPIDKAIIEKYLADNNLTAQSTTTGLYYIIKKPGNDKHPTSKSGVLVKYKGYLVDGTVFDQSYSSGQPSAFTLGDVIKGWQQGIPLIGLGGQIQLFIPSDLGYGATEQTNIPAHSVLIFDIELVDFY